MRRDFLKIWFILAGCVILISASGCDQAVPAAGPPDKAANQQPSNTQAQEKPDDTKDNKVDKKVADAPPEPAEEPTVPFAKRVQAPALEGGISWINSSGPVDLKDLRGKWVILDFWTYCCINCMHILPELKKLEHAHPNDLVVIGVHSAKFDAEQDTKNILAAALRYEIEHPIVNDAEHKIWDNYFVTAWPSIRVIDPEGYLVAGHSAEFEWTLLDEFIKEKSKYYEQKGLMNAKPIKFDQAAAKAARTPLRFPAKIIGDEKTGRLFISDSNHNRIVITDLNGTLLNVIGNGASGQTDGKYEAANFNRPQGMALHGDTLYIADTENHLLRKVDLKAKLVSTIAGLGKQGRGVWPGLDLEGARRGKDVKIPERFYGPPKTTELNSPWDLWIHGEDIYIAMAGPHQIWRMPLSEKEIGVYAGNGREDIVDGPLVPPSPFERGFCSFAQPSGLSGDDKFLYVADSEGSSIRAVPFDEEKEVTTIVGTAELLSGRLFQFGDVDGGREKVRLQHCLGVTYHQGQLYIADTYNSKIKIVDPKSGAVKTIAGLGQGKTDGPGALHEPSGLTVVGNKLFITDTNNHSIQTLSLNGDNKLALLEIKGLTAPNPPAPAAPTDDKPTFPRAVTVNVPASSVKVVDGQVKFAVNCKLPDTFKINALAPMRYYVEGAADSGPIDRKALAKTVKVDPPSAEFEISLPVTANSGDDKIKISVALNYCQPGDKGECRIGSAIFVVPVKLTDDAKATTVKLEYDAP